VRRRWEGLYRPTVFRGAQTDLPKQEVAGAFYPQKGGARATDESRLNVPVREDISERQQAAGLSRRALLGGALGISTLASIGIDAVGSPAAFAAAPTSPAAAIALGRSYLNQGLQQVRPQTLTPWAGYPNADWCAWFASWLLRGLPGIGYRTYVDQFFHLPTVASPQVGDLAFIGSQHIGLVTQVSPTIKVLDGNRVTGGRVAPLGTVVLEGNNYSSPTYRRPPYTSNAVAAGGLPMFNIFHQQDNNTYWIVGLDGRREQIATAASLDALKRFRDGMLTPGQPMPLYQGDFILPNYGNIQYYLNKVNGPIA
jgi:hypothetical protein